MNIKIFYLLLLTSVHIAAQENNKLTNYLIQHQTQIKFLRDSSLAINDTSFIPKMMQHKLLFVFGEGGSHFLQIHGRIRMLVIQQFAGKLKYYLKEGSHSEAYLANLVMNHKYDLTIPAFTNAQYVLEKEKTGALFHFHPPFKQIGIDFERPQTFYTSMKYIENDLHLNSNDPLYPFFRKTEDTAYLRLPINTANKAANSFFKFYRQCQRAFEENKSMLEARLDRDKYLQLKYLLSNPNTSGPGKNRNPPMADNFLNEISPIDTERTYLLSCGISHSRPNVKGSLVNILSKNEVLENKIIVMNVYCDNCHASEPISNDGLPFIQGNVLMSFQKAASEDIVLFDLSKLPDEYSKFRQYGDLVLFARNQN